jgi:hypothetical protein
MLYYFHLRLGHRFLPDRDGKEFDTLAEARNYAIEFARATMAELPTIATEKFDPAIVEICTDQEKIDQLSFDELEAGDHGSSNGAGGKPRAH